MRRFLALVGAVAMIGGALLVRQAIDDDDGEGGDDTSVVLCAADLAEICETLDDVEVEVVSAADAATRLASGDDLADLDGWITTSGWTEVLAARAPEVLDGGAVVARSPVVVAVDTDRASALTELCAGHALLGCLGEHAGANWATLGGDPGWGALKTGLLDADSAVGLAVLPAVAAGFFGQLDFAANDFDAGDFRGWLGRIAQASGPGDRDPVTTLVTRRGTYSAAVSTAARLANLDDRVQQLEVEPGVAVTIVFARLAGGDARIDLGALQDALVDAGWAPAEGELVDTLKPGVLAALHSLWTEVTR